jgi:hypothetical protein
MMLSIVPSAKETTVMLGRNLLPWLTPNESVPKLKKSSNDSENTGWIALMISLKELNMF